MRHNPLSLRLLLVLFLSVALITSIVSAADPALHSNLSNTKNPVLSAAAINSPESPLSGQLMFSYENGTQAWTLQTTSTGWRARLFPTRVAAPDSKKALLSPVGTKETRTGGNRTDPFAVIDEKLAPSEAAALKSLIQNTLHAFSYNEATGDWYARNAANQITFTYTQDGTAKFSEGTNTFGLTLLGIGRGDGLSPAGKGNVQADRRQLNITRPEYTEWYRNNDEGVEQGMTIASPPTGSGLLHVGFGLTGDNTFSLKDKKTLILTGASGKPLFEYTSLHAFSSDGRDLPAVLATDGTTLYWVVDDTGAVYPITIDPVVVSASKAKATFTGGAASDRFGNSVALNSSGAVALVGAYYNSTAATEAGAAYIFTMPTGGWSSKSASAATATFTGGAKEDSFGNSVALNSSGAVALIGAYQNCTTVNGYEGAAYIFEAPGGVWSGTTSASKANATFTGGNKQDNFGNSVALNSSGAVALIGAYNNDTATLLGAGAAYIFIMPSGGWTGTTKSASAADATFTGGAGTDYLGTSVALNSTGAVALVGAYNNATAVGKSGAAYIFTMPATGWSGTTSASAANATFTGGAASDYFGWSVALNSTGAVALVGAPYNDTTVAGDEGAAYIFTMPAGGWSGTKSASAANVTFTGGAASDNFGYSVALNSMGAVALVGAYNNVTAVGKSGAAYFFNMPTTGWSGTTSASAASVTFTGGSNNDDQFGYSVALNSTGAVALVGANQNVTAVGKSGAAYIFPTIYLIAGGTTTGTAGRVVNDLTLNPTGTLTNVDLFLGTDAATPTGTAVKTGISSLPASVATTINSVDLTGKTAGTYYLIVNESGTTNLLAATTSAVYTVNAPAPVVSFTSDKTSGAAPLAVTFTDHSTNIPIGWAWFFGDENWTVPAWTQVNASSGWTKRYSHTSVVMPDGSIVLMGGQDSVGYKNDVWRSTNNGTMWTEVNTNADWSARYGHTSVAMPDGSIVLMGGNAAASYYNDVWNSLDNGASWTKVNASAGWTARKWFTSVAIPDGSIVLMGGYDGTYYNDVWNSTDIGATWTQVTTSGTMWSARNGHTSVVMPDGSIVLMGGNDGSSLNDVWRSTNNGTTWTQMKANAVNANNWSARSGHTSVAMPDGSIVLMGGRDSGGYKNDVWRSTDIGATWTRVNASAGWSARDSHTSVVMPNSSIVLMGGIDGSSTRYNDTWLFQPANSSAQSPSHTYTAAGTYNVSLQAYNAVGYNSTRKAGYITVTGSTTPVASFSSRNTSTSVATNSTSQGWAGVAPFTMVFNDTSTGPPTSWVWNATNVTGNNVPFYINTTTVTLANISYSFRTAGNYTIKLNATNSGGSGISGITWVNVSSTTLTFTSITPNSGPTAGGTAVSIIGANFVTGGSLGVTIGGANANAVFVDSTHLTATTPAGSAGAQNIVITNNDGGTVTGTGAYTYVAPTPAPTPTNSGGDSDGPAAPVAPLGPVAPVVPGRSSTSEVNVGGNSAVTQVTITGIGISDVIVTGTVVSGPGLNTAPPTPMVYEYVDITPARYTTISDAMISFTVPITWLTERQLTPPNVVMYHLVEQTWVALPTTLVKVENGVAYYTAASPGFSRFAITGQFNITSATPLATPTPAAPLATLTPTGQTFGDLSPTTSVTKTPTPTATVTIKPVTSQTTAILAAPQPAPPLPLPTIAIVAGVVVVLVAGGFLIRRWWIRRQNPALFRELD